MIILKTIRHAQTWSQVQSACALTRADQPGPILYYGKIPEGLQIMHPAGDWGGFQGVFAGGTILPGAQLIGLPVRLASGEELPTGGLRPTEPDPEWWYAELDGRLGHKIAPDTYAVDRSSW